MKNLFLAFAFVSITALAGNLNFDLRDGSVPASLNPETRSFVAPQDQIAAVADSKEGDVISFSTPEGTFQGAVVIAETDINGVLVRAGNIEGDGGSFFITISDGGLYGHIESIDTGRDVKWEYVNGVQTIKNLSFAEAEAEYLPCGKDLPIPEGETAAPMSFEDKNENDVEYVDWDDDEEVPLRIAVFYTPRSLEYAGSHARMNYFIAEGIAKGNLCHRNSKSNTRLVLVHSQQWNYTEAATSYVDLSNFYQAKNGWEGVWEVRNRVGANLCTIVAYVHDVGGLAYVNSSSTGMPEMSYHLIRVLQMTGSSWVHEMGHNIGCNHAHEQESSPGPESGGVFGHSLGYYFTGNDRGHYGTVMAYDQGDYHRCDYFSSSNNYFKGTLVGNSTRNNTLTWRKIRKIAKTYRILPQRTFGEWAYEGFNYPAGERLDLKTGGQGWNNGWTPDTADVFPTTDESLQYSDGTNMLATTKGALKFENESTYCSRMPSQQDHQGIHYDYYGETSIWLSCLLKPTSDTHGKVYVYFLGCNVGITHDDIYALNSYTPLREVHPVTGKTDLMLVRYRLLPDNDLGVTVWIDPKIGETPNDADAIINDTSYLYYSGYKDLTLYINEANFMVDELRLGFSAESVLPPKAPYFTASQDENAESVVLSWDEDASLEDITVYRAESDNFALATVIGTQRGGASYTDTTVESGKIYYYWVQGQYAGATISSPVGSAIGYAGAPKLVAKAGGPYVVTKGEDVMFSAKGSIGDKLTYAWKCYNVESDFSPYYGDFLRTNNFKPGTYEVTLTVKDLNLTNAAPVSAVTELVVMNSAPKVEMEKSEYDVNCGVPATFHAVVKDAMPEDKFQFAWKPTASSEPTEWQDSSYFTTIYDEPNSSHTMICYVKDNYGGTNACSAVVNVGPRKSLMSAEPMTLDFKESDTALLRVINSGAEPYTLNIDALPEGFRVYPKNAVVSNGVAVLAVRIDRHLLRFPYSGTLDLGFTNVSLAANMPWPTPLKLNANGPYVVKRGDTALLSANGTPATQTLKYLWSVDGEALFSPDITSYLQYYTLGDIEKGEHTLTLSVFSGDNTLLASTNTTLTVVESDPEMIFGVKAIEGNEVTASVFLPGNGTVEARTPMIQEGWFGEGEIKLSFEGGDCRREYFEVKDSFGNTNRFDYVFDLRSEVPRLVPEISIDGDKGFSEYSFPYGYTLNFEGSLDYSGEAKYYWREWNGNPVRNVLADPFAKQTGTSKTLLPGTYYFELFVCDEEGHLSLPAAVKVVVEGLKGVFYVADGEECFFLNGASVTSADFESFTGPDGSFAAAEEYIRYKRLNSAVWRFDLVKYSDEYAKPERMHVENWQSFSGTVVTNFPWGEGPLGGAFVTSLNGAMSSQTVTDDSGAFALVVPENAGPTSLTFSKQSCQIEPVETDSTATLKIVPERNSGNPNSYLYLTVVSEESNFFLENAEVSVDGVKGHTNAKGVCSNLSAPKGVNTVKISLDGYDAISTNFTFSGSSTMRKVALKRSQGRRGDNLDLIIRDTDEKTVSLDSFRLVLSATSSVIVNYTDNVPPLLSIPVLAGQKVIIRAQKSGYENFAENYTLSNYNNIEITLIPEPVSLTVIAILLALAIAKRKKTL